MFNILMFLWVVGFVCAMLATFIVKNKETRTSLCIIFAICVFFSVGYLTNEQYHWLDISQLYFKIALGHTAFWLIIWILFSRKSVPIVASLVGIPFTALFVGFGANYIINHTSTALGIFIIAFCEFWCWGFFWPHNGGMAYNFNDGWIEIYPNEEVKKIIENKSEWTTQDMETEKGQKLRNMSSIVIATMNIIKENNLNAEDIKGYRFMNLEKK